MRISGSMLYDRITGGLNAAQRRLAKASAPLMSGHRVEKPSDDPIRAQRLAKAERAMSRSDRFRANGSRNMLYHQVVETTVQSVVDALSDLSNLANAHANDTMTASERMAAAGAAEGLLDSLKSYGNAKFNGRFLFSGRLQDQPAFDANGVFQGDAVGRKLEISEGVLVKGDVTGPEVFGPSGSTAFEAAQALVDALNANDTNAIQDALGKLNAAHATAVEAMSQTGTTMVDIMRSDSYEEDQHFTAELRRNKLDEVDVAEAASQMSFAETTYQTAIQVASRINRLLDSITRL